MPNEFKYTFLDEDRAIHAFKALKEMFTASCNGSPALDNAVDQDVRDRVPEELQLLQPESSFYLCAGHLFILMRGGEEVSVKEVGC